MWHWNPANTRDNGPSPEPTQLVFCLWVFFLLNSEDGTDGEFVGGWKSPILDPRILFQAAAATVDVDTNKQTHTQFDCPLLCSNYLPVCLTMNEVMAAGSSCVPPFSSLLSVRGFSARTHTRTHTQRVSTRLAGGWRVSGCMEYSKATAAKTSARKGKHTHTLLKTAHSARVSVCVCVSQLAQSATACGRQSGAAAPPSRKHLISRPSVKAAATAPEDGGGPAWCVCRRRE